MRPLSLGPHIIVTMHMIITISYIINIIIIMIMNIITFLIIEGFEACALCPQTAVPQSPPGA